jgi:hypothetical protein
MRFLLGVFFICGLVSSLFYWFIMIDERPPLFFPLHRSDAEYVVTRKCPNGQGWDVVSPPVDDDYCIEYRGVNVFMDSENRRFFRITVGRASMDLEPYLGKRVQIVDGEFVYATEQCIQTKCAKLSGSMAVLNVYAIELSP